jgi:hypothetical protein
MIKVEWYEQVDVDKEKFSSSYDLDLRDSLEMYIEASCGEYEVDLVNLILDSTNQKDLEDFLLKREIMIRDYVEENYDNADELQKCLL